MREATMADPILEETAPLLPPTEDASAPLLDPPTLPTEPQKVHPLSEGGRRFEQVYARSKQTERELLDERDKRIRLEAQLELLQRGGQTTTKVYSWDQLEPMIAAGQVTRGEAQAHRDEVNRREITEAVKREVHEETSSAQREQSLGQAIYSYVQASPNLQNPEDPTRQRVDAEFDQLVEIQGHDLKTMSSVVRKSLELTALRAVIGPKTNLSQRMSPVMDTHQGSIGGTPPNNSVNPDQKLLDALSPREVAHYNRAIKHGHYANGWKDVVAELKFARPQR